MTIAGNKVELHWQSSPTFRTGSSRLHWQSCRLLPAPVPSVVPYGHAVHGALTVPLEKLPSGQGAHVPSPSGSMPYPALQTQSSAVAVSVIGRCATYRVLACGGHAVHAGADSILLYGPSDTIFTWCKPVTVRPKKDWSGDIAKSRTALTWELPMNSVLAKDGDDKSILWILLGLFVEYSNAFCFS